MGLDVRRAFAKSIYCPWTEENTRGESATLSHLLHFSSSLRRYLLLLTTSPAPVVTSTRIFLRLLCGTAFDWSWFAFGGRQPGYIGRHSKWWLDLDLILARELLPFSVLSSLPHLCVLLAASVGSHCLLPCCLDLDFVCRSHPFCVLATYVRSLGC